VPLSPRAFAGFNPRAVNQITGKEILPRRLEELGILRGAAPPGAGAAAAAPGASALGGAPSPGAAAAAPGAPALDVAFEGAMADGALPRQASPAAGGSAPALGAPLGAVVAPPPGVLARAATGGFAAPPGAGAPPPFRLPASVPPLPLFPPANSEPLPTSGRSVLPPVGKRPALGAVVPQSPRALAAAAAQPPSRPQLFLSAPDLSTSAYTRARRLLLIILSLKKGEGSFECYIHLFCLLFAPLS
jgi:hypothetical protein